MKTNTTLTIFRKWATGEVIALFPLEAADRLGYFCNSYAHVGQHGAADPHIVNSTTAATKSEYSSLAKELRRIGYSIKIGKRVPTNALQIRRDSIFSLHS